MVNPLFPQTGRVRETRTPPYIANPPTIATFNRNKKKLGFTEINVNDFLHKDKKSLMNGQLCKGLQAMNDSYLNSLLAKATIMLAFPIITRNTWVLLGKLIAKLDTMFISTKITS